MTKTNRTITFDGPVKARPTVASRLVSLFLTVLLTGWIVMLVLGGIHSDVEAVPALGFWPTVGLLYLLSIIAYIARKGFGGGR